jgi:hypothetical protein
MKILLLGDFSALHTNLKEGLLELGHDVTLASNGDGWKNLDRDIDLIYKSKFLSDRMASKIMPITKISELTGFDVVQLINPFTLRKKNFPNKLYFNLIKLFNSKIFLSAAGDDSFFWTKGRKALLYSPFEDFLKYDEKSNYYYMENQKMISLNEHIANKVNGIIPIMHEYEISYQKHPKLKSAIPIPINTKKINYLKNKPQGKISIFHGLNRYGFKGTRHVEKAFETLKKKYPNDLDLHIKGKMPLHQYLELMKKTNIIIDQTNSYSLGVNGIYALAMGKIVLGGCEPESLKSLNINHSPVINIKPNSESIVKEIEHLLEKRSSIEELSIQSRVFAEQVHDYIKVSSQYLKTWEDD